MPFRPLSDQNRYSTNTNEINNMIRTLNKEQTVKTFKQATGNAIIVGKLPYEGGYGSLYYDSSGVPSIVIGILPDGTTGIVTAKSGENVIDAFS